MTDTRVRLAVSSQRTRQGGCTALEGWQDRLKARNGTQPAPASVCHGARVHPLRVNSTGRAAIGWIETCKSAWHVARQRYSLDLCNGRSIASPAHRCLHPRFRPPFTASPSALPPIAPCGHDCCLSPASRHPLSSPPLRTLVAPLARPLPGAALASARRERPLLRARLPRAPWHPSTHQT